MVLVRALGPRDLAIGDVADQQVAEGVLLSPATAERRSRRTNSLRSRRAAARRAARPRPASAPRAPSRRPCRGRPRSGARLLVLGRQRVEPGGDDALDRLRQWHRPSPAASALQEPRSCSIRTYSSAKSGLPPARRAAPLCISAGSTACRAARRDELRRLLVRERRQRDRRARSACRRPSPAGARAAPAAPSRRRAAGRRSPSRRARRRSRASPRRPSAGPRTRARAAARSASASRKRRQAAKASPRRSARRCRSARPTSGRRWRSIQSASAASSDASRRPRASFASAASAASVSRMPACALTISPSAQKRDALAVGQRAALAPADELGSRVDRPPKSSATSRLLPIPGTPTSVTSCG